MIEFEHISDSRLFHMRKVAEKLVEIAQLNGIDDLETLKELYVLGFLHDIGYAFDPANHAHAGGEVLNNMNLKNYDAIYNHGFSDVEQQDILSLLNAADMMSGPNGEDMTISERLSNMADRYGENSPQKKCAMNMAAMIQHVEGVC